MRRVSISILFFFSSYTIKAQQVIAQWNFNTPLPPDNRLITGSTLPSMGNGVIGLIGGAGPSNSSPFNAGTDNDYFTNGKDNSGWNITKFPIQSTANKTAGIQFAFNTTGFQNIILKFDEKHSNSAANTSIIQYNPDTLNVAGWIDIQTNKISSSPSSTNWQTHTVDFTAIPSVNNKPRMSIRVVAAFDPADGANYVSTFSQTAATYNPTGGTIRFDMITVTGSPISGCTIPSTQASNPYIISNTGGQVQFSFDRGNGDSVLIICREGFAVNDFPKTGSNYLANANFGSGTEIGTGNYVIYKSSQLGKNIVTLSGLTSAKNYHFAIFEFSNQHCYKYKPLYFHTSADGTVFKPGELLLLGFDAWVFGTGTGNDKVYLTNLVDIKPGTQFCLTASRFEAGAAPNTRTNRWYNSGDFIFKDLDVQEFTWTGTTTLVSGSIIGIEDKYGSVDQFDSITINGVYQPNFISDNKKGTFNIPASTTKGEQIFITQGSYYPEGDLYIDRYNLLVGHVLFGMSLFTDWVPFNLSPGTANSGIAYRASRVPPEIMCMHITNLSDTTGMGYYTSTYSGTKRFLKGGISNASNWNWRTGDSLLNITQSFTSPYAAQIGRPPSISPSTSTDGTWVGDKNTDWFECGNWEGLYPTDSTTDVILNAGSINYPVITANTSCKTIHANSSSKLTVNAGVNVSVGKLQ
ncbi:MAG: hypothetical protein ACOYLO_09430 [Ferruginibacter sp.]